MIILFAKNNAAEIVTSTPFEITSELTVGNINTDIILTAAPFELTSEITVNKANSVVTTGAAILFFFTLTGAADGTTNIDIPLTSFQTRMRNSTPTYLQVVLPGVDYADDIAARSHGTMKIDMAYKKDGEVLLRNTIVTALLEDVMLYEGPMSSRTVLVGHKTETFITKTLELRSSNYRNVNNGYLRHRLSEPNIYIRPGDTVIIGNDTFSANVISYFVSVDSKTMEVGEN